MPNVEVAGLTKKFNGLAVVDDISFRVPDGTFTTLLGPSGCGKTTTLRMLAGFERPDGGSVAIGDRTLASGSSITAFVPPEKRNVGVVFQSYALWPHMTAAGQVGYPLKVRHTKKSVRQKMVRDALALVGLGAMSEKYPSQLSGGQQQRIALARALVFEPSVLLLDEPLSNLDAELRKQMRDELARLHERLGITFVYVTHDQSEALALSDQILLMKLGRIVQRGTPAEVYAAPSCAYSAQFVGAANCLRGKLTARDGEWATAELDGGGKVRGRSSLSDADELGSPVIVAIKPEDVGVRLADDRAGDNELIGVVRTNTYLGSQVELTVELESHHLTVHTPKWNPAWSDSKVCLHLPADAVRLVREADDIAEMPPS
jgi:iron(III) transport system ATP-binding protein